mmetsp:Transcript_22567/g.65623  ORF Transcript_22567/g.65623 Transcript_22567/m.65623 type:complete len:303 (-) Transcript_22567:148-1056(-)
MATVPIPFSCRIPPGMLVSFLAAWILVATSSRLEALMACARATRRWWLECCLSGRICSTCRGSQWWSGCSQTASFFPLLGRSVQETSSIWTPFSSILSSRSPVSPWRRTSMVSTSGAHRGSTIRSGSWPACSSATCSLNNSWTKCRSSATSTSGSHRRITLASSCSGMAPAVRVSQRCLFHSPGPPLMAPRLCTPPMCTCPLWSRQSWTRTRRASCASLGTTSGSCCRTMRSFRITPPRTCGSALSTGHGASRMKAKPSDFKTSCRITRMRSRLKRFWRPLPTISRQRVSSDRQQTSWPCPA